MTTKTKPAPSPVSTRVPVRVGWINKRGNAQLIFISKWIDEPLARTDVSDVIVIVCGNASYQ